MTIANISEFRKSIASYLKIVQDKNEIVVISGNGKKAVLISMEAYNSFTKNAKTNKKRTIGLLNSKKIKVPTADAFNAPMTEIFEGYL